MEDDRRVNAQFHQSDYPRASSWNVFGMLRGLFAYTSRFTPGRPTRLSRAATHLARSRRVRGAVPPALGAMNAYGGEGPQVVSTLSLLGTAVSSTWTTARIVMLGGQAYITYKWINLSLIHI